MGNIHYTKAHDRSTSKKAIAEILRTFANEPLSPAEIIALLPQEHRKSAHLLLVSMARSVKRWPNIKCVGRGQYLWDAPAPNTDKKGKKTMIIQGRSETILDMLAVSGTVGVTWKEVADHLNVHHGSASSVLSNLHRDGQVVRLVDKREGSSIYVLPKFVNGRAKVSYKANKKIEKVPVTQTKTVVRYVDHQEWEPLATDKDGSVVLRKLDGSLWLAKPLTRGDR